MAGASKKLLPSGLRRFWYTDWSGKRIFKTQSGSYKSVLAIAHSIEAKHSEMRLKGVTLKPWEQAKNDSVADTIEQYLAWGNAQGGRGGRPWSAYHSKKRKIHLAWWSKQLNLKVLADLNNILPRVERALRELQKQGQPNRNGKPKPLSGKSLENYVESLRAFCLWAKGRGLIESDPLNGMANFDTTPVTTRRAATVNEIKALLAACAEHRRLAYEVAFCTGLRVNELRNLTAKHLDTERGGLKLEAAWTKGRREGFQPLAGWLLKRLTAFMEAGGAAELYSQFKDCGRGMKFTPPPQALLYIPSHPSRDLEKDLKAAGLAKFGPGGKLDFHALRVAYTTFVFDAGANAKEAQTLARHTDPKLTLNIYARARDNRLAELAEAVGAHIQPSSKEVAIKTGTNNQEICAPSVHGGSVSDIAVVRKSQASSTCDVKNMVEDRGVERPSYENAKLETSANKVANFPETSYENSGAAQSAQVPSSNVPENNLKPFEALLRARSVHGIPDDLAELARLWESLPADMRTVMLAAARAIVNGGAK